MRFYGLGWMYDSRAPFVAVLNLCLIFRCIGSRSQHTLAQRNQAGGKAFLTPSCRQLRRKRIIKFRANNIWAFEIGNVLCISMVCSVTNVHNGVDGPIRLHPLGNDLHQRRSKSLSEKYQKLVHNRCTRCNLCKLYNTLHF